MNIIKQKMILNGEEKEGKENNIKNDDENNKLKNIPNIKEDNKANKSIEKENKIITNIKTEQKYIILKETKKEEEKIQKEINKEEEEDENDNENNFYSKYDQYYSEQPLLLKESNPKTKYNEIDLNNFYPKLKHFKKNLKIKSRKKKKKLNRYMIIIS